MKKRSPLYHLSVWTVYAGVAVMLLTGLSWLALEYLGQREGEFGLEKHPAQYVMIRVHAAMGMGMMMILGGLLATHIRHFGRRRLGRATGFAVLAMWCLLIVSAYALYYLAGETSRQVAHWIHIGLGITLPMSLIHHVIRGRRSASESRGAG